MNRGPQAPSSLLEMQTWFGGIARRPLRELDPLRIPLYEAATEKEIERRISPGPHLKPAQRIGIYNQQYWFRLFTLLQEAYPTLIRLFGYDDFNDLIAEPYLQKYSNLHWSIPRLGARLPQWIDEEYKDDDRLLVLQAAQVDEIHERVFSAPQQELISTTISKQSDFWKKTFYLQPFVSVISLSGDFFAFREALIKEEPLYWEENDFPKIDGSKKRDFVLSYRQGNFWREEISPAEKTLLQAFEKGASLADACSKVEKDEAAEKIGDWLQNWAAKGWFTTEVFRWV
jgi:hypothetical protein